MTTAETFEHHGYTIEIKYDEDAGNPLAEFDELLTVILHRRAERHFGWTTDANYADLFNDALDRVAEHGHTTRLHGAGGALAVVVRWLKAFHGVTVALPISAIEHSGTAVYLGDGAAPSDPGGWDSGWIGLAIDTPERRKVMGFDGTMTGDAVFSGKPWNHPETIEIALRQDFESFRSWIAGEVYGWVVLDPDGDEIEAVWGYYGEREWAPWAQKDREEGYMLTEAKAVIDADIAKKAEKAAARQAEIDADEAEVDGMRAAEIGMVR